MRHVDFGIPSGQAIARRSISHLILPLSRDGDRCCLLRHQASFTSQFVDFCRGSSAAELATTLKVAGEVYCPVCGEKRLPTTTNKRRTHPVLQPTSYRQLAKSRWNDAAPASGNLQRNRERTPLWCDLRHNFVAGFQWPCRSLDFGLSGYTQSYFTARDFLHDEFLTFPVQHVAIDSSTCSRLRALQRLNLSDHGEHEKESKKNWHDHSSLFFSLLTLPETCQSGIRLPAKFKTSPHVTSSAR